MTPFESIFYMVWRGLAVGILISAPMGPVGILCIQRTLDRGRKAGLSTGIGAAISDLIYCLLTGFGLSFIEDFLQENSNVIQLVGSLVLIAFGIYLFKKNPTSSLRRPVPQNVSVKKNILGGFLFTFSNPLIIFLIIGLFARFNFTAPEIDGGFYAIGYLFIIVGALLWWYVVTYLINKVRGKFNMRSMKVMNIIIGIVILAFAVVGIVTSIMGLTSAEAKGAEKYFSQSMRIGPGECCVKSLSNGEIIALSREDGREESMPGSVTIFSLEDGGSLVAVSDATEGAGLNEIEDVDLQNLRDWRIGFRVEDINSHPGKKYGYYDAELQKQCKVKSPGWIIKIKGDEQGDETDIEMKIYFGDSDSGLLGDERAMILEVSRSGDFFYKGEIKKGVDVFGGWNAIQIESNRNTGLRFLAGNHGNMESIEIPGSRDMIGSLREVSIMPGRGGRIDVQYPMAYFPYSPGAKRTEETLGDIRERLRLSGDIAEGYWQLFDYTLEESKVRLGGTYQLAIIANPAGGYDIVYLSGGDVNGGEWESGMIKGRLKPTGLTGIYDVEWRDSRGKTLAGEIKAQIEGDVLTIHLPDEGSRMRYHRVLPG